MFSRYGNPKMCKPEYREFAVAFKRDCATAFLSSYITLLAVLPAGGYLPDRVVNLALQYLTTALAQAGPDCLLIVYRFTYPHGALALT